MPPGLLFFRDQLSHQSGLAGHFHNGDRGAEQDGIEIPSDSNKNMEKFHRLKKDSHVQMDIRWVYNGYIIGIYWVYNG